MIARAVCPVLIGREDELSVLEDALLAAARGDGSVVLLAGDAGMGKTRLCAELVRRADRIGAAVMEGSCSEAELALPYLPFLEAVGNYLESANVAVLAERLGVHARQLASLFPQLPAEGATGAADSPDARLRLFEAVLALLRIAAEEGGLLLVLEDLHWADASTRELLDYITRRLRSTRVLVLATYRRDEMHRRHPLLPTVQGWQRSRLAQVVDLDALQPEGVARMVSAIFDDTDVGNEFRDFIHQRSEGNPFVLEEMLKEALDRGDIFREGGDWQRKPLQEVRIPDTVRDTILLRLERLDPEQVDILRCAAVLGRTFDHQLLIQVAAADQPTVETALQAAALQQLLEEDRGSGRYRFRHALTQEAIHDDMSVPMRERLHSAAADVLRERPGGTAERAYHLREAHRWEEAVPATMAAAEEAEARFGYGEAADLYERLLPVVTGGAERARLLCRLGEALWLGTRPKAAIEPLQEGSKGLVAAGETEAAAGAWLLLGRCLWETGQVRRAGEVYEEARAELEAHGPSRELALAYIRLAGLAVFDYRAEAACEAAERAIAVAEAAGQPQMRSWALNYLGMAVAFKGDYPHGVELLERSASEAIAAGLPDIAGNALHNLIPGYMAMLRLDRLPELADRLQRLEVERWSVHSALDARATWALESGRAAEALERGLELHAGAEQAGSDFYAETAGLVICLALVELDRLEEARRWQPDLEEDDNVQGRLASLWGRIVLEQAADDSEAALADAEAVLAVAEGSLGYGVALEAAAGVLAAAGRLEDAARLGAHLRSAPAPISRLQGEIVAGVLAAAGGDAAPAVESLRSTWATLDRAGYVLHAGRARLVLGEVLAAAGDREAAESELRGLVDHSRRLGLRLLERRAREHLARLGIAVADEEPVPSAARPEVPREVGERLVTVMFADVRGYTAMTGQTPPAEMLDRISAYQRWAAQEVERNLGTVDKFAGDAVMATFNVSGAQVDHAEHALRAARALRDKAALLGLPVGIGIATGAAVVGRLADGANVSVVGATTNLAARLQAEARAGEILLSVEARSRLPDVDAEPERLELKGFEALVTAYRIR